MMRDGSQSESNSKRDDADSRAAGPGAPRGISMAIREALHASTSWMQVLSHSRDQRCRSGVMSSEADENCRSLFLLFLLLAWRHYLGGRPFTVWTDHQSLQ